MRMTDITIREAVETATISSAFSCSFCPSLIAALGPPPDPMRFEKAVMSRMIGYVIPTPVSISAPAPSICPRYILSTMLYNPFTSCATIIGIASFITSPGTLLVPSSLCSMSRYYRNWAGCSRAFFRGFLRSPP